MLRTLKSYFCEDLWTRKKKILMGSELYLSILVAAACVIAGRSNGFTFTDFSAAYLAYAAISMGFCLAGLTLALTLPDASFAEELATTHTKSSMHDSYTNLLFIFSWTAMTHWLAVVATMIVLIRCGSTSQVLMEDSSLQRKIAVGVLMFTVIYSFCHFVVTLGTLSQVGKVYIRRLKKRARKRALAKLKKSQEQLVAPIEQPAFKNVDPKKPKRI
jgi:hypothetical protein